MVSYTGINCLRCFFDDFGASIVYGPQLQGAPPQALSLERANAAEQVAHLSLVGSHWEPWVSVRVLRGGQELPGMVVAQMVHP